MSITFLFPLIWLGKGRGAAKGINQNGKEKKEQTTFCYYQWVRRTVEVTFLISQPRDPDEMDVFSFCML